MSTGRLIIAPDSPPATPPTSSPASRFTTLPARPRTSFDLPLQPNQRAANVRHHRDRDTPIFPFDEDISTRSRPDHSDTTSSPGNSGRAQSNYSYPPSNHIHNYDPYPSRPRRRTQKHVSSREKSTRNHHTASAPISIPPTTKFQEMQESAKREHERERQRDRARRREKAQQRERNDSAAVAASLASANNGGSSSNSLDD